MAEGVFRRPWDPLQKRRVTLPFTPQVFAVRAWPSARTAERIAALYAYQAPWKPPQARHYAPLVVVSPFVPTLPSARRAARAAAYGLFLPAPNPRLSYRTHDALIPAAGRAWPSGRIAQRAAAAYEVFHPAHFTRLSVKLRDAVKPPATMAWPSARIAQRTAAAFEVFHPPHFVRISTRTRDAVNPPAGTAWPSARIAQRVSAAFEAYRPAHNLRLSYRTRFQINPAAARAWPSARIAQRVAGLPFTQPPTWLRTDYRTRFAVNPPATSAWPSRRIAERYGALQPPAAPPPAHRRVCALQIALVVPPPFASARIAQRAAAWGAYRVETRPLIHRAYGVRSPATYAFASARIAERAPRLPEQFTAPRARPTSPLAAFVPELVIGVLEAGRTAIGWAGRVIGVSASSRGASTAGGRTIGPAAGDREKDPSR